MKYDHVQTNEDSAFEESEDESMETPAEAAARVLFEVTRQCFKNGDTTTSNNKRGEKNEGVCGKNQCRPLGFPPVSSISECAVTPHSMEKINATAATLMKDFGLERFAIAADNLNRRCVLDLNEFKVMKFPPGEGCEELRIARRVSGVLKENPDGSLTIENVKGLQAVVDASDFAALLGNTIVVDVVSLVIKADQNGGLTLDVTANFQGFEKTISIVASDEIKEHIENASKLLASLGKVAPLDSDSRDEVFAETEDDGSRTFLGRHGDKLFFAGLLGAIAARYLRAKNVSVEKVDTDFTKRVSEVVYQPEFIKEIRDRVKQCGGANGSLNDFRELVQKSLQEIEQRPLTVRDADILEQLKKRIQSNEFCAALQNELKLADTEASRPSTHQNANSAATSETGRDHLVPRVPASSNNPYQRTPKTVEDIIAEDARKKRNADLKVEAAESKRTRIQRSTSTIGKIAGGLILWELAERALNRKVDK